MAERFVYPPTVGHAARVAVDAEASVAVFTGAALAGHDWAGAQLWICPDDAPPYKVGTIAEVDPHGGYDNLELPLFRPWNGDPVVAAKFELLDGPAIANGATQAAIYARFAAFLEQNMGLAGNTADDIDFALVPNNSLFVDESNQRLYQWRNGVLQEVITAPGESVEGVLTLLSSDETDSSEQASSTSESGALKTYSLGANEFSYVKIEAEVRFRNDVDGNNAPTGTFRFKEAGVTKATRVLKSVGNADSGADAGPTLTALISCIIPGGQVGATALTITAQNSVNNSAIGSLVHAFRVYGIMDAEALKGNQGVQGNPWDQWEGPWLTSTAYVLRAAVGNNGSSYICISAHTSGATTEPGVGIDWETKWDLVAAKGDEGEQGEQGAPGENGSGFSDLLGEWDDETTYASLDLVSFEGSSYVSRVDENLGNQPDESPDEWQLVAAKGEQGDAGAPGDEGDPGATGAAGAPAGLRFDFDNNTSMADPGAGDLRLNHGTLSSVTAAAVDDLCGEAGNPDVSAWVLSFDDSTSTIKGFLTLHKQAAPENFAIFAVTGLTDNSGWTQLALTHIASAGSFSNTDVLTVNFVRNGDKGDTGEQGEQGEPGEDGEGAGNVNTTGAPVVAGHLVSYDDTSGDVIEDSGIPAGDVSGHLANTSNPHSVTKAQVGLGNVTNDAQLKAADLDTDGTLAANSDAKVPSQKAVKTYADTKAPIANPTFTGAVTLPGDPASSLQAATKQYVDGLLANLGKRARVRAATTGNVTISTALNNGDTLDGVTLAAGDWVLVKDQSSPAENGLYEVAAAPARITEFDTYNEHPGSLIAVQEGTANADTLWLCTSNVGGTLNSTAIAFSKMVIAGELLAANNLSEVANAATAFGNIKQAATTSATGVVEKATTAELGAATADKFIAADHLATALGTLADAGPVVIDWQDNPIGWNLTITANRQIGNPSNEVPGQSRVIYVLGNSGTDRTITFGNQFLGDIPSIVDCDSGQPYLLIIFCAAADKFIVTARKVWT